MANTRAQELNTLIADNHQNKEDIKNINANLSSINSSIQTLQDQCAHITSKTSKPPLNTSWVVPRTLPLLNNHLIRMTMTLPITKVLILPTFLETSTLPELR
jgi:hypothetical protein